MDTQSTPENTPKNIPAILENGQSQRNKDFPVSLKFQNDKNEREEIVKFIQALADKLIELNLVEWHKVQLKDGRKGYALFFPTNNWELVENELIEIKNN